MWQLDVCVFSTELAQAAHSTDLMMYNLGDGNIPIVDKICLGKQCKYTLRCYCISELIGRIQSVTFWVEKHV